MAEQYLAIADADKIHEYVFSPHELRLIKGGSFLQSRMNTQRLPKAVGEAGGDCISKSGGTVVATFGSEAQAAEFCRNAEYLFQRHTRVATVTTAIARYSNGRWGGARDELQARLEAAKFAKDTPHFLGSSPFWTTCQACGLYPASHAHFVEQKRWLCEACQLRKKEGTKGPRWLRQYDSLAETFEDIGTASEPENYLAFVYVDIDRLGRYMRYHGTTERRWRELSKDVDHAVVSSVLAGCSALKGERAPVQVLLAGGDDAIVALPADQVFRFLQAFQNRFLTCRFRSADGEMPTFSVGVAVAHSHYPIFEFRRLAEELLRSAKRIEEMDNSIDLAIVTASMTDSVLRERERVVKRSVGPRRTAKPYTLDQYMALAEKVRLLKSASVPSGKVRHLYQMVYQGEVQAEVDYLYLVSRLESKHRDAMREAVGPQLWKEGSTGTRFTEVADLVELWDFIR